MYSCFVNIFLALQDWDFPHFMNNFDIKLPGLNTASYSINLPKYFKREDWAIHITGENIATFLHAMTQVVILQVSGIVHVFQLDYSLSGNLFFPFFVTKRSWLPSRLGKPLRGTTACMYKHTFCLNSTPQNVNFAHYRSHCKICPLPTIANKINTRDLYCWQSAYFTMGPNEQNKHFAELRQKVCLYIHIVVLLKMFAKFGLQTRTFCHKKMEKAVAKLESDRL